MTKRQSRLKNGADSLILIVGFIVGMVVPYYAVPPLLLLAIAMPWLMVAYYWRTKQLSRDRFGRVFQFAGMMSIMVLAMNREIRRIYILDVTSLYILAAALSAGLILLIFRIPARKKTEMKLGTISGIVVSALSLLGAFGYLCVSSIMLNTLMVRSPTDVYSALVVEKYISRGGYRRGTDYYLNIGPWELLNERRTYSVTPEFHRTVMESKSICFYVYNGFLGASWYRLDHCNGTQKRSHSSMDSASLLPYLPHDAKSL